MVGFQMRGRGPIWRCEGPVCASLLSLVSLTGTRAGKCPRWGASLAACWPGGSLVRETGAGAALCLVKDRKGVNWAEEGARLRWAQQEAYGCAQGGGKEPSAPFLNRGYLPSPQSPLHFRVISSFPARCTGGTRSVGEGAGATLASLAVGKRLFQIVLWLRSELAHAGSRIPGMVGWVSSLWVGTQPSQAHAWESDQPVFRAWLCCESWGKSSDLSELRSPVQHGGPGAPLEGSREKEGQGASQAPGSVWDLEGRCGLLLSRRQKWGPKEGEGLAGVPELSLQ